MKQREVILVGAGGHANSLTEFSAPLIAGYIAGEPNPGLPGEWMGTDEDVSHFVNAGYKFHVAFIYSGLPLLEKRRKLIEKYEKAGALFSTLVSPSAIITPNSFIGEGCAIMTGAIINRAKLGKHVVVNSGAIIEHDCVIGDNTFLGPGAIVGGFSKIGNNCFIGLGARIGNNVTIGDNISIAMGAVVNHSINEPGIYHGNPLRCFKGRT